MREEISGKVRRTINVLNVKVHPAKVERTLKKNDPHWSKLFSLYIRGTDRSPLEWSARPLIGRL